MLPRRRRVRLPLPLRRVRAPGPRGDAARGCPSSARHARACAETAGDAALLVDPETSPRSPTRSCASADRPGPPRRRSWRRARARRRGYSPGRRPRALPSTPTATPSRTPAHEGLADRHRAERRRARRRVPRVDRRADAQARRGRDRRRRLHRRHAASSCAPPTASPCSRSRARTSPAAATSRSRTRAHDVIAVADADCAYGPGWLGGLLAPLEAGADVAMGWHRADRGLVLAACVSSLGLPLSPDEVDAATFMPSARSVAFRREAIDAVGGYPEWLAIGEDMWVTIAGASGPRPALRTGRGRALAPARDARRALAQYFRVRARGRAGRHVPGAPRAPVRRLRRALAALASRRRGRSCWRRGRRRLRPNTGAPCPDAPHRDIVGYPPRAGAPRPAPMPRRCTGLRSVWSTGSAALNRRRR